MMTTTTTTTTMMTSIVDAGVSATDKQRDETRGEKGGLDRQTQAGKETESEYESWRTLKAGRGGVYLRRSERSDKWRGALPLSDSAGSVGGLLLSLPFVLRFLPFLPFLLTSTSPRPRPFRTISFVLVINIVTAMPASLSCTFRSPFSIVYFDILRAI